MNIIRSILFFHLMLVNDFGSLQAEKITKSSTINAPLNWSIHPLSYIQDDSFVNEDCSPHSRNTKHNSIEMHNIL